VSPGRASEFEEYERVYDRMLAGSSDAKGDKIISPKIKFIMSEFILRSAGEKARRGFNVITTGKTGGNQP